MTELNGGGRGNFPSHLKKSVQLWRKVRVAFLASNHFRRSLKEPPTEFERSVGKSKVATPYRQGARVYVADKEAVWQLARVTDNDGTEITVMTEDGQTHVLKLADNPPLKNPDLLDYADDLTKLSYLHEAAVLSTLRLRYMRDEVYTYCGIVLVALNPFKPLTIYGKSYMDEYHSVANCREELEPHIYALAEQAYHSMSHWSTNEKPSNQSIIVSGESGAGKTVTAKYAMGYFTAVARKSIMQSDVSIEDQVLASNPVLEAFGNAKTVRNNNSSRFGKYIQIFFDDQNTIVGAKTQTYLLEKSRVMHQAKNERGYHIFYQLCQAASNPATASELQHLALGNSSDYKYLTRGDCLTVDGMDDVTEFGETRKAMVQVGILDEDQQAVFKVLAAILHLGNLPIEKPARSDTAGLDAGCSELVHAASLLGVKAAELRKWLLTKRIKSGKDTFEKPLTFDQSEEARDSLVKLLYTAMFGWMVDRLNRTLMKEGVVANDDSARFIGILDIYGFEVFDKNSFEQFCINYANEKLQQQFIEHVFKLEQELYKSENIQWEAITFPDNEPCLRLIEDKKTLGVLALLDEEVKMGSGTDESFLSKLEKSHKGKEHFDMPRGKRGVFVIIHFAAPVTYTVSGFLEKNRDTVGDELVGLLRESELPYLRELFPKEEPDPDAKGGRQPRKPTVAAQFSRSLTSLMTTLKSTTPHYCRCLKPNQAKVAYQYDVHGMLEQLRACGVLETVRMSAAGYPSRWLHVDFSDRYEVLLAASQRGEYNDPEDVCVAVINEYKMDPTKYQIGKTKVFFRSGQVAYLEQRRTEKFQVATKLRSAFILAFVCRMRFQKKRALATLLQTVAKGWLAREHVAHAQRGNSAVTIQRIFCGWICRRRYTRLRQLAIHLQAWCRGHIDRTYARSLKETRAATTIQAHYRGSRQRKNYLQLKRSSTLACNGWRRIQAKRQLAALRAEAKSVSALHTTISALEQEVRDLRQQLSVSQAQTVDVSAVETQKEELARAHTQIEALRQQLQEASDAAQTSKDEQAQLQAELEQSRNQVSTLETSLRQIEKEKTAMQTRMEEVRQQLETAQNSMAQKENQKEEMQAQLSGVQQELVQAQEKLVQVQEQLTQEQEQRTHTQETNAQAQEQHTQAQEQLVQAQEQLFQVQEQLAQAQEQLTQEKEENTLAQEQLAQAQEHHTHTQEQLAQAQEQLVHAQEQLSTTTQQLTEASASLQTFQQASEGDVEKDTKIQSLAAQLEEAVTLQQRAEKERVEAQEKLADLATQLERAKVDLVTANEQRAASEKEVLTEYPSSNQMEELLPLLELETEKRRELEGKLAAMAVVAMTAKQRSPVIGLNGMSRDSDVQPSANGHAGVSDDEGVKEFETERAIGGGVEEGKKECMNDSEQEQETGVGDMEVEGKEECGNGASVGENSVDEDGKKGKLVCVNGFASVVDGRDLHSLEAELENMKKQLAEAQTHLSYEQSSRKVLELQLLALTPDGGSRKNSLTSSRTPETQRRRRSVEQMEREVTECRKSPRWGERRQTLSGIIETSPVHSPGKPIGPSSNPEADTVSSLVPEEAHALLGSPLNLSGSDRSDVDQSGLGDPSEQLIRLEGKWKKEKASLEATITTLTEENTRLHNRTHMLEAEVQTKGTITAQHIAHITTLTETLQRLKEEVRQMQAEHERANTPQATHHANLFVSSKLNDVVSPKIIVTNSQENLLPGTMYIYTRAMQDPLVKELILLGEPVEPNEEESAGWVAHVLFKCLRYLDHTEKGSDFTSLMQAVLVALDHVVETRQENIDYMAYWLCNIPLLLNLLKDSINPSVPETCRLRNYDPSQFCSDLERIGLSAYTSILEFAKDQVSALYVDAILEGEPGGSQSATIDDIIALMTDIDNNLTQWGVEHKIIQLLLIDLADFTAGACLNDMMERPELCQSTVAERILQNLMPLRHWLVTNLGRHAAAALDLVNEACELLQVPKGESVELESALNSCGALNVKQAARILTAFTPGPGEIPVSENVLRGLEHQAHQSDPSVCLMVDLDRHSDALPFQPCIAADLLKVRIPPVCAIAASLRDVS